MSDEGRAWSSAGYWVCSHSGCSKKVNPVVSDHDCCGKPRHDYEHELAGH